MNNQELKVLARERVSALEFYIRRNPDDKSAIVDLNLCRIALTALSAKPVKVPDVMDDSIPGKNDSYIDKCQGWNSCRAEVLRLNAIDNTAQQYEALAKDK